MALKLFSVIFIMYSLNAYTNLVHEEKKTPSLKEKYEAETMKRWGGND